MFIYSPFVPLPALGSIQAVVARREGILDETLYNAPRSEGGFVPEALYEEQVADEPKRLQVAETR